MEKLSIEDRLLRARAYYAGYDPNNFVPPRNDSDRKALENGLAGLESMGVAAPQTWDSVTFDARGIPTPSDPLIQEAMEIMRDPDGWRAREEQHMADELKRDLDGWGDGWDGDSLGRHFV